MMSETFSELEPPQPPSRPPPQSSLQKLCLRLMQAEDEEFQEQLHLLTIFFNKGLSHYFTKQINLMRKMMNYFNKLDQTRKQSSHKNSNYEYRMIYILSLIAEMIQQNPKLYFPFSRRFLINVFNIDCQQLKSSPKRNQILAIIGTVITNISKQGRLLKRYKIFNEVKTAILTNYCLVQETYSLKLFNDAILNLVKNGQSFTGEELAKFDIYGTIHNLVTQNQIKITAIKTEIDFITLCTNELSFTQFNLAFINQS